MSAVCRADLVVFPKRDTHAGCDRLLTDVQMEEARHLALLEQPAGRFFEEADSHHATMEIAQDLDVELSG